MEENLYDEFGNYIGPELSVSDDGDDSGEEAKSNSSGEYQQINTNQNGGPQMQRQDDKSSVSQPSEVQERQLIEVDEDDEDYAAGHEIVLHEDKQYYPDPETIFGKGVENLVMEEDAQPLTQPIIQPPRQANFQIYEKSILNTTYSMEFLAAMSQKPDLIRSVAVCGHLHHGKSLLCDMIIQQTHIPPKIEGKAHEWDLNREYKWTDNRKDEFDRQISIKCSPLTVLMPDSREKTYMFNLMDTPGHPSFSDEVTAAFRICDGALIVVDCIEGMTFYVERLVSEAIRQNIIFSVVLNKLDRLVLELKLPPSDAYYKIKYTLDYINSVIQRLKVIHNSKQEFISPLNGNVVFASTLFGCCFTIQSFALRYAKNQQAATSNNTQTKYERHSQTLKNPQLIDHAKFAKFLWGDLYYNEERRKFERTSSGGNPRSFVHFVLEPFYKVVAVSISEEREELEPVLTRLGVYLKKKDFSLDIKPLVRLVLRNLLGDLSCLVDSMVSSFPTVKENTKNKVAALYESSLDSSDLRNKLTECDPQGPLCINIVKLFNNELDGRFYAFGRIISGTLKSGQDVKVLGENFNLEEEEDMVIAQASKLWILQAGGRFKIEIDKVGAGNWVAIEGVDLSITKTATITTPDMTDMETFKKLEFHCESAIQVACEPLNPSELPKMIEGLRKINKSYPMVSTKVEESGEHIVIGSGELYLDQIFYDLRKLYAEIEIKVSEPFVKICETVVEVSSVRCFGETPNKKNQISMMAEPLDRGLAEAIQNKTLFKAEQKSVLTDILVNDFEWDELTASSVWAFGPNKTGSNMLIDYTLDGEVDKQKINFVKGPIVQGFQWATREGPLCEEQIKNVKFKLLEGEFADEPVFRGGGQIIPTARRVAYSSFLLASPRIMEPIYIAEVHTPQDCIEAIYNVLIRRRAHVIFEEAKPGSPLHVLKIEIPGIESFGFETDLRTHTMGQAMALQQFSHWAIVPGDPLDKSIELKPLEPAQVPHLARELMVKTRRRKGLLEDVSVTKFFDSAEMTDHAKQDPTLLAYF